MATTKERLNEMQSQLGAMQETLKRIETHYLKQLETAGFGRHGSTIASRSGDSVTLTEVSGSRGRVPEVKNRKLTEAEADRFVAAIGGQFSQLLGHSPFERSVSFEGEEK